MLWKCCTQYVSKFGKLNSGHRIGKGQFSFQSHRRTMPKNAQTTVHLYSFHMLARLCLKSFKLGFSSVWTENFQMYKLGFKEAEGPKIKLSTFAGSWRKQGSSRKISTSTSLTMLETLTVWITTNYRKFLKRWENQTTLFVSWETCMQVKKQQLESNTELTSSKLGKVYSKAVYCQSTYLTYKQSIWIQNARLDEAQVRIKIAGRNVNNHRYADTTLMAETKEPLDVGERGEWKRWLETQH